MWDWALQHLQDGKGCHLRGCASHLPNGASHLPGCATHLPFDTTTYSSPPTDLPGYTKEEEDEKKPPKEPTTNTSGDEVPEDPARSRGSGGRCLFWRKTRTAVF